MNLFFLSEANSADLGTTDPGNEEAPSPEQVNSEQEETKEEAKEEAKKEETEKEKPEKEEIELSPSSQEKIEKTTPKEGFALRRTVSGSHIFGLEWSKTEVPLATEKWGEKNRRSVLLHGTFEMRFSTLSINEIPIPVQQDGSFKVKILLKRKSPTVVEVTSVRKNGEESSETVELVYESEPDPPPPPKVIIPEVRRPSSVMEYDPTWGFKKPKSTITSSLGYTTFTYLQTEVETLTQSALTAKLWFHTPITPRVDFGMGAFYTGVPLASSRAGTSVQWVGGNLRLGYSFERVADPYKLTLVVGGYVNRMLATASQMGYPLLIYPQIYPVLRRRITDSSWLTAYLKFAPLAWNFDLTRRELVGGLEYTHQFQSENTLSLALDYSDLKYAQSSQASVNYALRAITLSIAYGF